jgi:hypothetical protein
MRVWIYPTTTDRVMVLRGQGVTLVIVPQDADDDAAMVDSLTVGDLITDTERAAILAAYGVDTADAMNALASDGSCRSCGVPESLRPPAAMGWPTCITPDARHLRAV